MSRIITFPCPSNFDDYLEGKLLPECGDSPVRPTYNYELRNNTIKSKLNCLLFEGTPAIL